MLCMLVSWGPMREGKLYKIELLCRGIRDLLKYQEPAISLSWLQINATWILSFYIMQ